MKQNKNKTKRNMFPLAPMKTVSRQNAILFVAFKMVQNNFKIYAEEKKLYFYNKQENKLGNNFENFFRLNLCGNFERKSF